jgi:hypothetical protein
MNAINPGGNRLFPSKKATEPFATEPAHGTHGWCKTGSGECIMFIFMKKDGLMKGWYTPKNFTGALKAKRTANRIYYENHPHLLGIKRRNRDGYHRYLRVSPASDRFTANCA